MKLKILIILSLVLFTGCTSTPKIDSSMLATLNGTWNESSEAHCSSNYHTIAFSGSVLKIKYVEKGYISETDGRQTLKYNILNANDKLLRVQLIDETRLDSKGKAVVWHIKSIGTEQYCWGRDDWAQNECTPPRYKCKPNKQINKD